MRLTNKERNLASNVLMRVIHNLSLDDESGDYRERYEDWRLSMSPADYELLKQVTAKIMPEI